MTTTLGLVGIVFVLALVILYAVCVTLMLLRQRDRIYTPVGRCRECDIDPYNEYGTFVTHHHPHCPIGRLGL